MNSTEREPPTEGASSMPVPPDGDEVDQLLRRCDLSQVQVATLLGLTPQAVSKGFRDWSADYLFREGRAEKLFKALTLIGGRRHNDILSALRLEADRRGLGPFESRADEISQPSDVYSSADEIWVISDLPGQVLDWEALRGHLIEDPDRSRHKVVVFFLRSLEAAERWAETLDREFAQSAINDGFLDRSRVAKAGAYIFLIVTNALTYSQDFIIAEPGSPCVGVPGPRRSPTFYLWADSGYMPAHNPNTNFIGLARSLQLGTGSLRANFFPKGEIIRKERFDFQHRFMDGLIAVHGRFDGPGEKSDGIDSEDSTAHEGERAGGILGTTQGRPRNAVLINRRMQFVPAFVLVYRKRPGEGPKERSLNEIDDDLKRARELDSGLAGDEVVHRPPRGRSLFDPL